MAQEVPKAEFEKFDAANYKVGIVASQFNREITGKLVKEALNLLRQYFVPETSVTVKKVSGSIEIPVVLQALAKTKRYDCLVALGAIIRGETAHFDYVAKIAAEGVLRIMLDYGIPVGFGVLTVDNLGQAEKRIHVGAEAAEAALQSAKLIKEIANEFV